MLFCCFLNKLYIHTHSQTTIKYTKHIGWLVISNLSLLFSLSITNSLIWNTVGIWKKDMCNFQNIGTSPLYRSSINLITWISIVLVLTSCVEGRSESVIFSTLLILPCLCRMDDSEYVFESNTPCCFSMKYWTNWWNIQYHFL